MSDEFAFIGLGMAFGVGLGALLGTLAFGNIPMGSAVGVALWAGLGNAFGRHRHR